MAFIQYTMQIIMDSKALYDFNMLPRAAVAADRAEEVLKSETMIHDPKKEKTFPWKTEKEYLLSIMYLSVTQVQMKMFWKILHYSEAG